MKRFIPILLSQCLCFCSIAQTTTGGLQGQLSTIDGAAIDGANLILTGPALQGEVGATSNRDGFFQFNSLPIGNFKLTITHVSFRTHEMSDISVALGVISNLGPIKLEAAQTQLEEVVILSTPFVLPAGVESSRGLSKTALDKIPVGRDFKEAITVLPQVNTSYYGDGLSIAGGTGAENLFYLDGINITSTYTSAGFPGVFMPAGFLPYNFIKEVTVSSSGFEAQYGKALGGNVDVVTQSGSNDFKGQVFGFASGSFLNSVPKGGTSGSAVNKTSNYDGGFSFGGPIVKNKLWYYTAYSYYQNNRGVEIKGHGFFPEKAINHVLAAKFDWRVSLSTRLNLTLLGNPSISTPVYGFGGPNNTYADSITNPESVLAKFESGGFNSILKGHTELTRNTHLDYAVNYYNQRSNFGGTSSYGDETPQFLDKNTPTILSGGIGWNEVNSMSKTGGKIAVTHTLDRHDFKLGIEAEYNAVKGRNFSTDIGLVTYDTTYTVTGILTNQDQNSSSYTAYLQDNWRVTDRLNLQLGFRWDDLVLWDEKDVFQKFNNQYQPRLGISWFLDERETKKLSFYYGRVYQWVTPVYGRIYKNKNLRFDSSYHVDPRIPGSVPYDGNAHQPSDNKAFQQGKYHLDNMDQFTVEYRQVITQWLDLKINGLYKHLRDAFYLGLDSTDFSANGDYTYSVGNPGKGTLNFLPPVNRQYWALEIGLQGRQSKTFNYSVNYVLSRNYGNYAGGWAAEDHGATFMGFASGVNTQAVIPNSTGLLPNDRTHVLKFNASYSFKFGLTLGTYLTVQSGTPLSVYAVNHTTGSRIYLEQRGSSGRTPTLWDLSFRFGYRPKNFPAKFFLDIFHVGDPQAIADRVQSKYLEYDQPALDPSFGKPVGYQPPMAIRAGVEFNF